MYYINSDIAKYIQAVKDKDVYNNDAYKAAYSAIIEAATKGDDYCHFIITEKDDKIGQRVINELRNAGFNAEIRLDRKVEQYMVEVRWW